MSTIFSDDTERSDDLWNTEAINYLHLNISLSIVTLIWKVYTLKCFNNKKALFVYFTIIIIIIIIS